MVTLVAEAIASRMDLPRGARVVVGVSGGADSLALLIALTVIARRRDAADRLVGEPIACHVHHHLRPAEEADADAAHVAEVCSQLGVALEVRHIHPGDEPGNLEANARHMRYEAMADVAQAHGISHVATAHHADDQFETMLMAFCRGAGPDGLAGMAWQRELATERSQAVLHVRPLLGVRRVDAESLCRAACVTWRDDVTNEDTSLARNRLRREVIPVLESLWPGLPDRAEFATNLMSSCAVLLESHLSTTFGPATERSWSRDDLRAVDAVMIVAGLRRALLAAQSDAADQISTRTLRDAAAAIRSDSTHPKQFAMPGCWSLAVDARRVLLVMKKHSEIEQT